MCQGAWVAATSVGLMEALKDQGYGRWNNTIRSMQQHAKKYVRSATQAKKVVPPPSSAIPDSMKDEEMQKSSEESLRTVMYLSCWGPNN
ncbi:hypothetical protein L6164_022290 [Bauhinia variegata]|uniref:Uncharacterized protein n=1 Tax=Bauhinia variegata TaxID=167791 RepID=A0ACB9MF72_BAUVA|nr:hypothetical protein L6164_022290 [Bauhinia variegata]